MAMNSKKRMVTDSTKHTSFSERRQESRTIVMSNAVASVESATKFLKEAGILDRRGNVSKYYRPEK
jgi:hypothetical protein